MKKTLKEYHSSYFGPGEETKWSYSNDTGMWYEDDKEVLPQPEKRSEYVTDFSCELKINYYVNINGNEQTLEDEYEWDGDEQPLEAFARYLIGENDYNDTISSAVIFKTPSRKHLLNLGQKHMLGLDEYSVWSFEDFINKLKAKDFAAQYIGDYADCKLISWKQKRNRTRFIVQSYNEDFCYKQIMFDITTDTDLLIKKLTAVIDKWKETVYKAIKEQQKLSGKPLAVPPKNNAVAHFFPDLFPKK